MKLKETIAVLALAAATGGPVLAAEIAPTDVVFEDGAITQSLSGSAGDVENGAVLMNKGLGNCIACHQVTALEYLPFHGDIGPSLDGAADRWSEGELRGIVANAKQWFPDTMMPSFYRTEGYTRPGNGFSGKAVEGEVTPLLTAQEIEDVVAFLMTLKEE